MFSKVKVKPTLSETYEEAKRESIEDYPEQSTEKPFGNKSLLLSKPKEE